ncbi:MAG: beta-galactosidase [Capsulimonadaceae bacterium]|nr:beta-galactosidase [Capsulimonadaceae bacterium]
MKIGTSYYPELIDEAEWEQDLDNMRAANLSVIRMLEFAWTAIEPREGCHDWAWLDRFAALAHSRQIELILCTPTATPPPWLTTQYPEVLIESRDGERRAPGGRRDADVDNPILRHYAVEIATKLGERYGNHPAVIGWQIDNELLGPEGMGTPPESHSIASTFRFRQYLKQVHGTLATLNSRWGTRFWSQEYSDWGEIGTPRNPRSTMGQVLDYSRRFSQSQVEFLKLQYDALRAVISPRQWVTHNSTAVFGRGLDHTDYHAVLDVAGWDAYPGAAGQPHMEASTSLAHDLFRSAKQKPFWVMETTAAVSTDGRKGNGTLAFFAEMRAHGADAILVWHWRNHRANAENLNDSICDYAGRPYAHRVAFLQALAARRELQAPLPADIPKRRAAILFCRDSERTALTPDPYLARHKVVSYRTVVAETYKALWQLGVAVDMVRPGDSLDGYDFVAMPSARLLSRDAAQPIRDFVARGGILLGVAKTAHQDEWGAFYPTLGEPLTDLLGFTVRRDEMYSEPLTVRLESGATVPCEPHVERIEPVSAHPVAWFAGGPLDGCVAGAINDCGEGRVYYAAGCAPALIERLTRLAVQQAGIPCVPGSLPDGVSVLPHLLDGGGVWVFNHGDQRLRVANRSIAPHDFALLTEISTPAELQRFEVDLANVPG